MAETMNGLKRTSYCGKLSKANVGNSEVVCGWVQKQRDKGHLIFIDLRDRTGVVQLVFDDDTNREVFEKAASVHAEYVLIAKGLVRQREAVNTEISTGEIEIHVEELRILSKAQTPPFEITDKSKVKEELRLKYRYLDLRRKTLQEKMILRHQVAKVTRDYFYENDFLEIETPMLIKSTPEGARDYLVPSRIHHGKFYALPQSPQIYKQLLMLSGFDRYIQLARCFRDEDLRADRQPEFTQVDLESDSVRLLLSSAWVENVRLLANRNVVMASPGSFVRYMESWGDQGAIMGTGQVEQVRAYGKALYVETPGTQVIALPGSDDVWAGGVLLGGGSLVTPGEGQGPSGRPEEPEEKPEEPEELDDGDSGSSGGRPVIPPDETEKWPMDQISLESAHTSSPISGVTAEEDGDTRKLKLEMEKEEKLRRAASEYKNYTPDGDDGEED